MNRSPLCVRQVRMSDVVVLLQTANRTVKKNCAMCGAVREFVITLDNVWLLLLLLFLLIYSRFANIHFIDFSFASRLFVEFSSS